MSALPLKADIRRTSLHVCFVPIADMTVSGEGLLLQEFYMIYVLL